MMPAGPSRVLRRFPALGTAEERRLRRGSASRVTVSAPTRGAIRAGGRRRSSEGAESEAGSCQVTASGASHGPCPCPQRSRSRMKTPNSESAREFQAGRRAPCPRLCVRRRARWRLSHQEEGQGGPSPPGCAFPAISLGQPSVCLQGAGGGGAAEVRVPLGQVLRSRMRSRGSTCSGVPADDHRGWGPATLYQLRGAFSAPVAGGGEQR